MCRLAADLDAPYPRWQKNTFIPSQDNLQITQSQADFPPLSFYPPLILLNLVIIENVSFFPWAELKKKKKELNCSLEIVLFLQQKSE